MNDPPPFRVPVKSDGALFALAVIPVNYIRGRSPNESANLVLYFSASLTPARFALVCFAADGTQLSYHCGDSILTTPENEILYASVHEGIPPRSWLLYPRRFVEMTAFQDLVTKCGYQEARHRVALLFRTFRLGVSVKPLFDFNSSVPAYHDPDDEAKEIREAVYRVIDAKRTASE